MTRTGSEASKHDEVRSLGIDAAGTLGWVGVLVDSTGFVAARCGGLAELVEWSEPVRAIGVDIPIGSSPDGVRAADLEARVFVGPRRSSVFAAPPASALREQDYATANRALAIAGAAKMSRQAWALVPKMLEAAQLADLDPRVHEVHPEVSFRAMRGAHLEWSKKSWNGLMLRRRLLAEAGIALPDVIAEVGSALADDVVDAAAVACTARRIASAAACTLPADPPVHDGRVVAIWY